MPHIRDCITKHKMDPAQGERVIKDYNEYLASGMAPDKANEFAIDDHQSRLDDEKESFFEKVRKLIPGFKQERIDESLTAPQKRAIKKAGFGKTKEIDPERTKVGVLQSTLDRFASIRHILGDEKAYMLATMADSASDIMSMVIGKVAPKLDQSGAVAQIKDSKGLKQVLEPLGNQKEVDRFFQWKTGNRSEQLSKEERENLLSGFDIKALQSLDEGKLENGNTRKDSYPKINKEYNTLNNQILQFGIDTGIISKEAGEMWLKDNLHIPFFREQGDGKNYGPMAIGGLSKQRGIHKLKGGTSKLKDPLANVYQNWNHIITAGLRNQAAVKSLDSATKMEIANEVPEQIKGKEAVYVLVDGQKKWFDVHDQLVLESLTSLNSEGLNNKVMDVARRFKRLLTMGVIISPGFKVRNLIRDSIHVMAVSKTGKNPLKNISTGWKNVSDEFLMAGGGFGSSGYIHGSDPRALKAMVDSELVLDSDKKITGMLKKLYTGYEAFGAKLENVNRAAQFTKERLEGKSLLEAGFNAKDQLNFSRTGSALWIRAVAQTVPFLNARLQGLYKMGTAFADPQQRKQFVAVTGMYAMASVALYLAMKDDEDYINAPEYEKRTYHLFKIPGTEKMFRIPRPFEVGAVAYMAEKMTEQFIDENAEVKDLGSAFLHTLSDTFAMNPTPQLVKPIVDVYANRNSFTGRPIESLSQRFLSSSERYNPWMGDVTKLAGKLTPWISPVEVNYLVKNYFGWLGSNVLMAADGVTNIATGKTTPNRKWWESTVSPTSSFVREADARSSKFISKFYNNMDEINKAWADIKKYRGSLKGRELLEKHRDKLKFKKYYGKTSKMLSKLRKRRNALYENKSLSSSEMREGINKINKQMNLISRKAVEVY